MTRLVTMGPRFRGDDTRDQSNHFLGLVIGLAVTAQGCRLGAGIMLLESRRDLGVLALEQTVPGKIALDQKRTEILHLQHPDRLSEAELFQPVHAGDAPDAAAEQRAGPIADRGEIDRVIRHKGLAIDLRGHAALADDDVAAGELEPAVEPLRETE